MSDPRPDPAALLALDAGVLDSLRAAGAQGFDAKLIARAEAIAPRQLDGVRLPLVHAWLRSLPDPAAIWARLFAYRDRVSAAEAEAALGPTLVAALIEVRALVVHEAELLAGLRLMPFAGLVLASDEADARHDPVMGPGATTFELWRAMAIRGGERVLDIGCGAGSLALAAARAGAREVVGVDLDPRAVAYARFNARLNAIDNARFEAGDLGAPVAGERFDWVVSQPPFVTQPSGVATTTYLHGGHRGDELSLRLLSQVPDLLAPTGRGLVLFDSADDPGLMDRIVAALGSGALRTVVVTATGHDADLQALGYASATHAELGPDYAQAAVAYRDHLRALEIEGTVHALVHVEAAPPGRPPFAARVESGTGSSGIYDAAALDELRAGLDAAAQPDAAVLGLDVGLSPHARLVHEYVPGQPELDQLRVRFSGGRARDRELSPAAFALVELLAASDSLAEAVDAYAEACDATPDEVAGSVVRFVRESLVSGLVVLVGPGAHSPQSTLT